MKRTTLAIAILAVSLAACGKGSEDAPKTKDGAAVPVTAGASTATAASKVDYALLPKDAEFVVAFSFDGFRTSALWGRVRPFLESKMSAELSQLATTCGFDPLAKFSSLVVAGKSSDEKSMAVVIEGFTKAEMTSCLIALATKEGEAIAITDEDGVTKVHHDDEGVFVAWVDATTAVVASNPDKAWIKARVARQDGLDGNAELMALLARVDPSAALVFAAKFAVGSEMDPSAELPGAQAAYGSVKVTAGIAVDGAIRFDTADHAKAALAQATQGIQTGKAYLPPSIGAIVDKVKLAAPGNDITFGVAVTEADIQAVQAMVAPLLGGTDAAADPPKEPDTTIKIGQDGKVHGSIKVETGSGGVNIEAPSGTHVEINGVKRTTP